MTHDSRGLRVEAVLVLRLVAVLVCVSAAAWMFGATRMRVVPALLIAAAAIQVIALVRLMTAVNQRAARALVAWRSGDFADASAEPAGAGGAELARALDETAVRLRERQRRSEQEGRYLAAIVSQAPVPLLAIAGARVELLNHAARRLFGATAVATVDDLTRFGASFAQGVIETPPGERRLGRITVDGVGQHVLISASVFTADGEARRLVSLQGIQSELDSRTIDAWLEMARVLAHEIMSSLTPVVSLTSTAGELLGEVEARPDALAEAREAIETVARRSDGLMRFVRRYRELAALPPPDRQPVDAAELVRGVASLLRGDLAAAGIALTVDAAAATPVRVDRALVEQALINLVRNASDAVAGRADAAVWLSVRTTRAGRVALEVADSGPGVPAELAQTIFVPFFTTKRGGSGIGLSLAQHVAHAHGGAVTLGERDGGGAVFSIVL